MVFVVPVDAHSGPPGGLRGNFHRARRDLQRYPLQVSILQFYFFTDIVILDYNDYSYK